MVEGDTETPLIVVATEDIARGELLVQVPWSHILKSANDTLDDEVGWYCGTAHALAEEMRKGADSFYAPYVTYLNDEPDRQLTHQYSPRAKAVLHQIIGLHNDEFLRSPVFHRDAADAQRLQPEGIADSLEDHWFGTCRADRSDEIATKAASMVIQRADDFILIPAYDAYNHRNNDKHNQKHYTNARTLTTPHNYHQTFALRDIAKGEQIFISYNMCEQCTGRKRAYFGTAEMYREYGFVEWFPQRWWYAGFGDVETPELAQFDLYQEETTANLTIVWTHFTTEPSKLERFQLFLQSEIRRLNRLKNIQWKHMEDHHQDHHQDQDRTEQESGMEEDQDRTEQESGITAYEWANIHRFTDANIVAMTLALEDIRTNNSSNSNSNSNSGVVGDVDSDVDSSDNDDNDNDNDDEDYGDPKVNREPFTVSPEELKSLLGDGNHYDPLDQPEKDDLAYYKYTCDISREFDFPGYIDTEIEIDTGAGQVLDFCESFYLNKDIQAVDVCMDVDKVLQICSSYRPQQHEYATHAAARFLPRVKRVAFVGGGDSMLLHEILKYPENDLELVVGLELDQTIPRKSFKHFHTDPHFDDPRVEWWFGDVAKSLLVLPESYWGSFDLVVVDLSERLLSKTIKTNTNDTNTNDDTNVDVFSALALLLNPDTGIMVKSELYLHKFAEVFDHSIELLFESPMLCSQTLALGSNGIDFFRAPVYDHGIAGMGNLLYTTSLETDENRHDMMHDYRTKAATTNTTTPPKKTRVCSEEGDEQDDEQETDEDDDDDDDDETPKLGVVELVTLEQPKEPFDSFRIVVPEGFHVLEHKMHSPEDPNMLTVTVLEEGYVAARMQEHESSDDDDDDDDREGFYLGFDVHLWSQTHRIEEFRNALRDAYGGEVVSSYKIVVGGMFGTVHRKDDAKHAGLPLKSSKSSSDCQNENQDEDGATAADESSGSSSSSSNVLDPDLASAIAIEETVFLTGTDSVIAAVFCGDESESCTSFDALKRHEGIKDAIPFYGCPSSSNGSTEMFACERKTIEALVSKLGGAKKLNMFVIDGNASHETYQIVNSIFDTHDHRELFLGDHSIAVTWSNDDASSEKGHPWARQFLDRYRKQIHHDPVKLGEYEILAPGGKKFGLGVVSTKDHDANQKFASLEKRIQSRLAAETSAPDATIKLRKIHGGLYNYVGPGNYNPKRFSQKDYDNTLAKDHFAAQIPLARQTIFQYETKPEAKQRNFYDPDYLGLSIPYLEKVLYASLASEQNGLLDPTETSFASVKKHKITVGDGCVFVFSGDNFDLIAVWDGREHLDINFFAFGDLLSATRVETNFGSSIQQVSTLETIAMDTQPRGMGRVVNFPEDFIEINRGGAWEDQTNYYSDAHDEDGDGHDEL